jgi:hypothetical protein
MSEKNLNQEMVECPHCENGTQYLSNYVSQECDYCDGNRLVKTKMSKEVEGYTVCSVCCRVQTLPSEYKDYFGDGVWVGCNVCLECGTEELMKLDQEKDVYKTL